MTILSEIIDKTKNLPIDEQLKQICDAIQKEEQESWFEEVKNDIIKGPNIFLSILVPGITGKETCFLCLEREFPGKYITSLWSKINDSNREIKKTMKRTKVWEIKETEPKKILENYAITLKFMRGQ
jgi:hypothetical protein